MELPRARGCRSLKGAVDRSLCEVLEMVHSRTGKLTSPIRPEFRTEFRKTCRCGDHVAFAQLQKSSKHNRTQTPIGGGFGWRMDSCRTSLAYADAIASCTSQSILHSTRMSSKCVSAHQCPTLLPQNAVVTQDYRKLVRSFVKGCPSQNLASVLQRQNLGPPMRRPRIASDQHLEVNFCPLQSEVIMVVPYRSKQAQ